MKFQYIGDGKDSPQEINFMGQIPFRLKGRYVEVSDPFMCQKLLKNRCFQVKDGEKIEEAEFTDVDDGDEG